MASQPGRLFGDVAPFGVQQRFGFQPVPLSATSCGASSVTRAIKLLAVMIDEIFRWAEDRLQMPVDDGDAPIDVRQSATRPSVMRICRQLRQRQCPSPHRAFGRSDRFLQRTGRLTETVTRPGSRVIISSVRSP